MINRSTNPAVMTVGFVMTIDVWFSVISILLEFRV
jgi:hypothetical protein